MIIVILCVLVLVLVINLGFRRPQIRDNESSEIEFGKKKKGNFIIDDTLKVKNKTYHFSSYIPEDYDTTKKNNLYISLPGWEGLYFQGVGTNMEEPFPEESLNYDDNLIVISPQLDDWSEQSADDTIFLTEYMQSHYNIDKTFISGVSGGGETLSLVLGKKPELYTKALHMVSKWDGDLNTLANAKVPLYIAIGENDNYYGSQYAKETYKKLHDIYKSKGYIDKDIDKLLVLDVKPDSYFKGTSYENNEHGGSALFAKDKTIMRWLFESNN